MSLFNSIGEKLDNLSKNVSEKNQIKSKVVRMENDFKNINNEIEALTKNLGVLAFNLFLKDTVNSGNIANICNDLKDKKNKALILTKQIHLVKTNSYECQSCSSVVSLENKYCNVCGERNIHIDSHSTLLNNTDSESRLICKNCNADIEEGAKFCTSCGFNVLTGPFDGKVNDSSIVTENQCNKCQQINDEDAAFCIGCGRALD